MKRAANLNGNTRARLAGRSAVLLLLAALCVLAFLVSVCGGAVNIPLADVWRALFFEDTGTSRQIVFHIRLPRTLCGALVGACLAVSGALLQGVMRNPLASPSVIGVSSGAGFCAMLVMAAFPGAYAWMTPAAFAGGLLTTLGIYLLAWHGGINPTRMILAGVAASTFLRAGIDALMVFFPDQTAGLVSFSVGGLSGVGWRSVRIITPYAAVGLVLALLLSQQLNVLMLGDDAAVGLGLHVERSRFFAIAAASLLAAAAVSVAGLIGFVGLIAPHLVRLFLGSDQRFLLPGAALGGAALVMLCDTLGRVLMPPTEVPVGILLAILGAPFFLFLLRERTKKHAASGTSHHQLRHKERSE